MPSRRHKKEPLPHFIAQLQQLMQDDSREEIVSWNSSGDAIHIHNVPLFTEQVLPSYFKHSNFSSFVRQLNMYGFRKVRHEEGDHLYAHRHFRRDNSKDARKICRKSREGGTKSAEPVEKQLTVRNCSQLGELKMRQKNLEQMCRTLMDQNQELLQHNQKLVKHMEQESKRHQRDLENCLVALLAPNCLPPGSSHKTPLQMLYNQFSKHAAFEPFRQCIYSSEEVEGRAQAAQRRVQEQQLQQPIIDDSDGFVSLSEFRDVDDDFPVLNVN